MELFLNFGLGIYIQRIGDRFNCRELSLAGRLKFDDLFYAFRHPIYQEVEYRELRSFDSYPEPVQKLRKRNLSFASTELGKKCQGVEYILEQKICRQKMLFPKGPVEPIVWKRISGAVDEVGDIFIIPGLFLVFWKRNASVSSIFLRRFFLGGVMYVTPMFYKCQIV